MKTETYLVCTFDSIDSESFPVEGNLTYEEAEKLSNKLLNDYYGVEIVDENSDNMEPIILVKTNENKNS